MSNSSPADFTGPDSNETTCSQLSCNVNISATRSIPRGSLHGFCRISSFGGPVSAGLRANMPPVPCWLLPRQCPLQSQAPAPPRRTLPSPTRLRASRWRNPFRAHGSLSPPFRIPPPPEPRPLAGWSMQSLLRRPPATAAFQPLHCR